MKVRSSSRYLLWIVGTSAEWADRMRSAVDSYSNGACFVTYWRITTSSSFRSSPLLSLPVLAVVVRWLQQGSCCCTTVGDNGWVSSLPMATACVRRLVAEFFNDTGLMDLLAWCRKSLAAGRYQTRSDQQRLSTESVLKHAKIPVEKLSNTDSWFNAKIRREPMLRRTALLNVYR